MPSAGAKARSIRPKSDNVDPTGCTDTAAVENSERTEPTTPPPRTTDVVGAELTERLHPAGVEHRDTSAGTSFFCSPPKRPFSSPDLIALQ